MLVPKEQMKIICKGIDTLVNEEELLKKLENSFNNNKPLVVKLGLDPSAPDIHIGHAVVLRKIRQIQDLGHKAVIVIGDFTGKIGDPTGKAKGRVALSDNKVRENAQTYCEQIFKILDKEKTEVRFNSEWLSRMNFEEVIRLAATVTVARMLERDDFQNRFKKQVPIGIHEFLYPLMQAYDSVELHADIELGGTDQTFNVLMGRTLQKSVGREQQIAIFMPILTGLDGVEKMSKSLNNYIGINENPEVMFKKVMEVPDNLIISYYELATDEHPNTIEKIKNELASGRNPRDVKYELAKIITGLYHSGEGVIMATKFYDDAFRKKAIPDATRMLFIKEGFKTIGDIIPSFIEMNLISSKSEFIRLIKQGGIQLNGKKAEIEVTSMVIKSGDVIKIGKKNYIRFQSDK